MGRNKVLRGRFARIVLAVFLAVGLVPTAAFADSQGADASRFSAPLCFVSCFNFINPNR